MRKEDNRIDWIDMAKGYGIILVYLGHMDMGKYTNWIYSFHMPLFFFLSGCVFRKETDFDTFMCKKSKTVLLPYFLLGVPMLVVYNIKQYIEASWGINQIVKSCLDYIFQRRVFTMWFLACLLCVQIMFYFIEKKYRDSKAKDIKIVLTTVVAMLLGILYNKYLYLSLPWNFDASLMMLPFFVMGYYYNSQPFMKKVNQRIAEKSIFMYVIAGGCLLLNIMVYCINEYAGARLEVYKCEYGIIPITYLAASLGIGFIVFFSKIVNLKPIQYIGKYSLLYFAWHQTLIIPFVEWIFGLFVDKNFVYSNSWILFAYKLIQLIVGMAILTALNELIRRTRLKVIIGR